MKKWLIAHVLATVALTANAQNSAHAIQEHLEGRITELNEQGREVPLIGANLIWLGTQKGTSTDVNGAFELDYVDGTNTLVISHIYYKPDTVQVKRGAFLKHRMETPLQLEGVEIEHRRRSTELSMIDPMKTEKITEKELQKAACCSLSESFETSPSVDVSFTDAVTGTRQIQLLGLSGPYSQITRENIPSVRGLSALYGLEIVPGTWIESIQLNKGAGSVVNGFESIVGQINYELRKPEDADPMYLNVYANQEGRFEANLHIANQLGDGKWSTATLLHGRANKFRHDKNNDGFLDDPLAHHFFGLNRWKYIGDNGLRLQFGVKASYSDQLGGQKDFEKDLELPTTQTWGMHTDLQRYEGWAKIGKVYDDMPWKSIALQLSGSGHKQESTFGNRIYHAQQSSAYANFLYKSIISNTNHEFRTGLSLQFDDYKEELSTVNYDRTEVVPGAYFEYTYNHLDKFNLVSGIRGDYHNTHGAFYSFRTHMRYAISESTVLRASIGRGQRTANVIAENIGILASSRNIIIDGDGTDTPYGLAAEKAWNYGLNLSYCFELGEREGTLAFDLYRTDFINQVVVDLDRSPQEVVFSNLDGKSFANSAQAQIDFDIIERFDVRVAYRWYDVRTKFSSGLQRKPLLATHRAFINLAYETNNRWKFDYTVSWQSNKRLPSTASNPERYRLDEKSPGFVLMNAQISKNWRDKFELYVGMENIANYKQEDPILASEEPFSEYFDASMIWGPIFGRKTYAGLRYWIK